MTRGRVVVCVKCGRFFPIVQNAEEMFVIATDTCEDCDGEYNAEYAHGELEGLAGRYGVNVVGVGEGR